MTLYDGKVGTEYTVEKINLQDRARQRFEILGMTSHSKVSIITKSLNGSMIIKIRGTRFAIGKDFAKGIEIKGGVKQ